MWIVSPRFQLVITNLILTCFGITTILDYIEHHYTINRDKNTDL